ETRTWMNEIANHQADEQCESRDHFEIEQRLAADATDFLHVPHAGDAGYYGAKNDQRNDHGDEADETIAQRLHGDGFGGTQISECHCEGNGDEDLNPEIRVERLFGHRLNWRH